LTDFLLFTFVFVSCNSAFGFLINDLGDRELDRSHGKRNTFLELGTTKALSLLAAVIALMVLSGLPFIDRPRFVFFSALVWLAAIAYSLPPLRLKERGAAGIATSSVAQWTLPVLLAFTALESGSAWELGVFLLATTVSGVTLELAHQRHDLPNDAATRTSTLAVNLGERKIDRLYRWALWADRIAVGVVLAVVVLRSQALELKVTGFAVLSAAVIFIYIAALLNVSVRLARGYEIDPYYGQRTMTNRILHDMTPNLLIPALLLTQLAVQSPIWSIALVVFLIWRLLLPRLN
jgi:4-hydroxybenzoate polyprenyltransferase